MQECVLVSQRQHSFVAENDRQKLVNDHILAVRSMALSLMKSSILRCLGRPLQLPAICSG
jgi:hypothetical protein